MPAKDLTLLSLLTPRGDMVELDAGYAIVDLALFTTIY